MKQKMLKRILKKTSVVLMLTVMIGTGLQQSGMVYGDTMKNEETILTEEQMANIKSMAEDKTYVRDVDDFSSVEAYEQYLSFKGESGLLSEKKIDKTIALQSGTRAVEKNAKKAITLTGMKKSTNAIQTFYIGSKYVYTVQKSGETVYLSRFTLLDDGKTAEYKDRMVLSKFGHCQTLEYFEWKGKAYFLMACKSDGGKYKDDKGTPYYWSLQIARVPYEASETAKSYGSFKRLCYINKANKNGSAFGETKRCDAALSSNKKTLLVWCRNTDNKMQFTRYDMNKINVALDESEHNYLSCGSESVKKAWLATNTPTSSSVFANAESSSVQGLELNDANCTYIASGPSNHNKYIVKLNSGCSMLTTIKINNSNLKTGTKTEIEGLQLKGEYVYFGICDHKNQADGEQYIYSVEKSAF